MARIRSVHPGQWSDAAKFAGEFKHVYVIREESGPSKIGYARNAFWRRTDLQIGNPRKLRICHVWECDQATAVRIEAAVLTIFAGEIESGEWINVHPDDIADFVSRGEW